MIKESVFKFIDISDLPSFKIELKKDPNEARYKRLEKLLLTLVCVSIAGISSCLYQRRNSWNHRMQVEHDELDALTIEYNQMCRDASKNNNYKNPDFKKKYFVLREKYIEAKKSHMFSKTNEAFSIFRKTHGICPACKAIEEELRGYRR